MDLTFFREQVSRRQAQERLHGAETVQVESEVGRLHAQLEEAARPIEAQLRSRRAAVETSRALQDTGNFTDRIKLELLTVLRPGEYDPATRARRDAEDMQYLSNLSATKNTALMRLQARLGESSARLKAAELAEKIALERTLAPTQDLMRRNEYGAAEEESYNQAQRRARRGTVESIQEGADAAALREASNRVLSSLSIEQLSAMRAENREVYQIGKQTIPRFQLDEHIVARSAALTDAQIGLEQQERELARLALDRADESRKQVALRTAAMVSRREMETEVMLGQSLPQLETRLKAATASGANAVVFDGVDIPMHTVQAEITRRQDSARLESIKRTVAEREERGWIDQQLLQRMSKQQLLTIKQNSYRDANGNSFTPEHVETAYNRVVQTESQTIEDAVRQYDLQFVPTAAQEAATQTVGQLQQTLPPSSPMQPFLQQWYTATGQARILIDRPDDASKQTGLLVLQTAQKRYLDQARAVAKQNAGDDSATEEVLFQYYASGTIDSEQVRGIFVDKLVKGDPIPALINSINATKMRDLYRQEHEARLSAARTALGPMATLSQDDKKRIQHDAADAAVRGLVAEEADRLRNQAMLQEVTVTGITGPDGSMLLEPHPLAGKETPDSLANKTERAKNLAVQQLAQNLDLSAHELMRHFNGEPNPEIALSSQQLGDALNHLTYTGLIAQLGEENVEAMLQWQERNGTRYIDAFLSSMQPTNQTVQERATIGLAAQATRQEWAAHTTSLSAALDAVRTDTANRMQDFFIGGKPTEYQAVLLGANPDLTEEERRVLWPHIARITLSVQDRGLESEAARREVETRIGALGAQLDTPLEKKAYKTMMRNRLDEMERVQSLMSGFLFLRQGFSQTGNLNQASGVTRPVLMVGSLDSVVARSARNLDFYKEWVRAQKGEGK